MDTMGIYTIGELVHGDEMKAFRKFVSGFSRFILNSIFQNCNEMCQEYRLKGQIISTCMDYKVLHRISFFPAVKHLDRPNGGYLDGREV